MVNVVLVFEPEGIELGRRVYTNANNQWLKQKKRRL